MLLQNRLPPRCTARAALGRLTAHSGATGGPGFSRDGPLTDQRRWLKGNTAAVPVRPFCVFSWLYFTRTSQLAKQQGNIKGVLVY